MTNREYLNGLNDEQFVFEILLCLARIEAQYFGDQLDNFDSNTVTEPSFLDWLAEERKED